MSQIYNVLFLCTANASRSIFAEALLTKLGDGRFRAHSGGANPKGALHPFAITLLKEQGMMRDDYRSKSWAEFAAPGAPVMDFIFTLCDDVAAEECPTWPGLPITSHWGVPDPSKAEGNDAVRMLAFRGVFQTLATRIRPFVALPIASLDRASLARQTADIGRLQAAA